MSTSLPRPALIALLGVAAIAGLFLMTRGRGGDTGDNSPAPPTPPTPAKTANANASKPGTPATPSKAPAKPAAPTHQQAPATRTAQPTHHGASRTLPHAVSRALDAHKVIVLLFWNPRGTDDRSVKNAVDSLSDRGGKVAVFVDRTKHVARYARITGPANVVQTPTLVVVDGQGQAQTATGFLDGQTVEQYVVDALHGAP
jgi:hypothetical protein